MNTVLTENIHAYPASFLFDLSEKLTKEVSHAMRAWGVPGEARDAIDSAIHLVMLAMSDPETSAGGVETWNENVNQSASHAAWVLEDLSRARAERVRSLSPEEFQRLARQ